MTFGFIDKLAKNSLIVSQSNHYMFERSLPSRSENNDIIRKTQMVDLRAPAFHMKAMIKGVMMKFVQGSGENLSTKNK